MIGRIKHVVSSSGEMLRAGSALRRFSMGRRVRFGHRVRFSASPEARVVIGDRVSVGADCGIAVRGELVIGKGTYLSPRSWVNAMSCVHIGDDCAIAWDVDILDDDFHAIIRNGSELPTSLPIKISDRVWIGVGVKILKGATIGHDSVVAAGAVVRGGRVSAFLSDRRHSSASYQRNRRVATMSIQHRTLGEQHQHG